MGSGGHDIQRCCFLRPHLENTGPWRCSPAFPGDSLGSVYAGGWALRVHRFSKAFTKRRSVCFVCWAQSVYFVMNTRMSPPHLCSALGGGRRRLLQAVLHLLVLTGAAGFGLFSHQDRGVSGKRPYGRLGLDMSPLPAVSGLSCKHCPIMSPRWHIFSPSFWLL